MMRGSWFEWNVRLACAELYGEAVEEAKKKPQS